MQRVACVDIGTVTVRLAVADVEGGRVQRLAKRSTICDVGEGLTATGRLSEGAKQRVRTCVASYVEAARAAGAPVACCTMTSASRDASNSDELVASLQALGLQPQVIPGEVEGMLTFLGVAQDYPNTPILIADNGGGSTELALGILSDGALDVRLVRSTNVGCRRVTERFLSERADGVATAEALRAAHDFAAQEYAPVMELIRACDMVPERLVACGGTVTSLVAMDAQLVPYDSSYVHLHALPRAVVERIEAQLAGMTVAQRAEVPGLQPERAPVILGGTVAISELLAQTGFDQLTVSESDLLFGLSLTAAACAAGVESPVGWRPTLASLG